jgi:CDC24 Calponin
MDQPILLQRQPTYPAPHHLQRGQTAPIGSNRDPFFHPHDLKRATSPIPTRPTHSRNGPSLSSTPLGLTPSSTPPLVVNGVPLANGIAAMRRDVLQSTPSLAPSTSTTSSNSTVSLYQTCIALRDRLQAVPGFQHFLELTEKPSSNDQDDQDELDTLDLDVVSHLWRCFMLGPSLCCIYNALQPEKKLAINEDCTLADLKDCKKAVYYFLVAIKDIVHPSKLFTISDLYNNNTNGIVKVLASFLGRSG